MACVAPQSAHVMVTLTSRARDNPAYEIASGERRTANGHPAADADWLASLVAEVLELPAVETEASILSLGATSLDMLRLAARLEHATGEAVELEELFTAPSLSALASRLPQPVVA